MLLVQRESLNITTSFIVKLGFQIEQNIEVTNEVMSLENVSDVGFPLVELVIHEVSVADTHLTL